VVLEEKMSNSWFEIGLKIQESLILWDESSRSVRMLDIMGFIIIEAVLGSLVLAGFYIAV
jgi:hypothetical protein